MSMFKADGIERNKWGHAAVDYNGETCWYPRISYLAGSLSSRQALEKWMQRGVAKGLAKSPALLGRVTDDLKMDELNDLCEEAQGVAGNHVKRNFGTTIHEIVDALDNGQSVEVGAEYLDCVRGYQTAIANSGFKLHSSEQFIVLDSEDENYRAAGSYDRIWETPDGRLLIGDLKTGQKSFHSFAIQCAMYAHGTLYDWRTKTRAPLPENLSKDSAIFVHSPYGKNVTKIYEVDISGAWEKAQQIFAAKAWNKTTIHKDWGK